MCWGPVRRCSRRPPAIAPAPGPEHRGFRSGPARDLPVATRRPTSFAHGLSWLARDQYVDIAELIGSNAHHQALQHATQPGKAVAFGARPILIERLVDFGSEEP